MILDYIYAENREILEHVHTFTYKLVIPDKQHVDFICSPLF